MQEACDLNFVKDLIYRGVFVTQWLVYRARKPNDWGSTSHGKLKFFCGRDKTKKKKPSFIYRAQNLPSLLFLSTKPELLPNFQEIIFHSESLKIS